MDLQMTVRANKALVIVSALALLQAAAASEVPSIAGTYTSLSYNQESGDLTGYEVRIIPSNQGNKAVVQVAEGDAGRLYLVDVAETSMQVTFDVPLASGVLGKFEGEVTKLGLKGVISYVPGSSEKVLLKRSASYWER